MPPSSSWLDRLRARFKRSTPSPPPLGSGPLLDLDRHSLGEVRIGDSVESLRKFATVEAVTPTETGDYRFCSQGIWFGTKHDAVDSFGVYWRDTDRLGFLPFSGWIRFAEERFSLDAATTEAAFVDRFGTPYWRDALDRREILLFYEFGEIEWQIEFSRKQSLCVMWIVSPPLLANPEQRDAYKVTRSWPVRCPSRKIHP